MSVDYSGLPESYRKSVKAYIEEGRDPGILLRTAISYDLFDGLHRIIEQYASAETLFAIVEWFDDEDHAPWDCWGSKEKMREWMAARAAERSAKGKG